MTLRKYLQKKLNKDMKTEPNEGAFAFGITTADGSSHIAQTGLTKREYFAALAMQGYMASSEHVHQYENDIADYAVRCADALIDRLNK